MNLDQADAEMEALRRVLQETREHWFSSNREISRLEAIVARVEALCAQPHQKWIAQGDLRDALRGEP